MDVPMENASPSGGRGVEVSVDTGVMVGVNGADGMNGRVGVIVAVAVGADVLVCRNGRDGRDRNDGKDGAGFLTNKMINKVRLVTSAEKIKKPMASRVAFLRIKE